MKEKQAKATMKGKQAAEVEAMKLKAKEKGAAAKAASSNFKHVK